MRFLAICCTGLFHLFISVCRSGGTASPILAKQTKSFRTPTSLGIVKLGVSESHGCIVRVLHASDTPMIAACVISWPLFCPSVRHC
ncbi:hypothetical protein B0T16DRAFT_422158 [Cercophora newfieldiana]|uniref:Secreted protein n=1 Tax=Cercophora newfieldiana TaxID=92897 RepID=A0AA40CIQ1_9PEZI|nr:hypothetical protein B0T16DRAFT_422158 [Cercophora newfieldiana]